MNNSSVHGLKYKAVVKPKNSTCYHTNNNECMQWGAICLCQDNYLNNGIILKYPNDYFFVMII